MRFEAARGPPGARRPWATPPKVHQHRVSPSASPRVCLPRPRTRTRAAPRRPKPSSPSLVRQATYTQCTQLRIAVQLESVTYGLHTLVPGYESLGPCLCAYARNRFRYGGHRDEGLVEENLYPLFCLLVDVSPADPAIPWMASQQKEVGNESDGTKGQVTVEANGGQLVILPASVSHRFVNLGPGPARHTEIHTSRRMTTEWLEGPKSAGKDGGTAS